MDHLDGIRFEDKTGSEEMYFHAEKDQDSATAGDRSITAGNDGTESVACDGLFELTGFPQAVQNREYLVVSTVPRSLQGDHVVRTASERLLRSPYATVRSVSYAYDAGVFLLRGRLQGPGA